MRIVPEARAALSLDDLVARAQARFPDGKLAWIETTADAASPVRITLARPGEPSRGFSRTNVWLDPYSGTILAVRDGTKEARGDIFLNWLHPLHAGDVLGLFGRLLLLFSRVCSRDLGGHRRVAFLSAKP